MPKKIDYQRLAGEVVPDICPSCGQKVDKRNPDSIAHTGRRGSRIQGSTSTRAAAGGS